jgi:hypothetical protein
METAMLKCFFHITRNLAKALVVSFHYTAAAGWLEIEVFLYSSFSL